MHENWKRNKNFATTKVPIIAELSNILVLDIPRHSKHKRGTTTTKFNIYESHISLGSHLFQEIISEAR